MMGNERKEIISITGAAGRLGCHLVKKFLSMHFRVNALVRNEESAERLKKFLGNHDDKLLNIIYSDLSDIASLVNATKNSSNCFHLAANMRGKEGCIETLQSTKNLLNAVSFNNCKLILVSSVAVMDYRVPVAYDQVNESLNVCNHEGALGHYALMKLGQENICLESDSAIKGQVRIVRLGMLSDGKNIPPDHTGLIKNGVGLTVKHGGNLPIVAIEDATKYLANNLSEFDSKKIFTIYASFHMTQTEYCKQLKKNGVIKLSVSLPWILFKPLCNLLSLVIISTFGSKKLPDFLHDNSVNARFKPLNFEITRI